MTWPTGLPQDPLRDGFSETLGDNKLRTPMEVGPGKERARGTAAADAVTYSFNMTEGQWQILRGFYKDTLRDVATFHGPATEGFAGVFSFAEPPRRVPASYGIYRVSISLIRWP